MSLEDRAELARRLTALIPPSSRDPGADEQRRRLFIGALATASTLLIPWIAVLAIKLPPRYLAHHWRLTWVGFDVALGCALAITAWTALHRRQIVVLWAFVSGTLLTCDAWFDVMTASGRDRWVSFDTAAFVELPLAALLFFMGHHLLQLSLRRLLALTGRTVTLPLHRMPLFGVTSHRPRDGAAGSG
jgi:hypothetical protein